MVTSSELQDQAIGVLLKVGKKEPAGLARCIALSSLGIFVYRELVHKSYHSKLKEAITVRVLPLLTLPSFRPGLLTPPSLQVGVGKTDFFKNKGEMDLDIGNWKKIETRNGKRDEIQSRE